ncbi:MAG: pseudouridine-5'-phosphate glycosidase, partial [Chloroflexota bacterium]
MRTPPPQWLQVSAEVQQALLAGTPVVALETTVITHGLPRPANLEMGLALEEEVRRAGAVPATVGVVEGQVRVGLTRAELERLAATQEVVKVSRRDLGVVRARRQDGGTTVAATMLAAHAAGIRLLATGGIGGVHRGQGGDVSADLPELARTPVAVVCSGAKSVLDLPRTLEWLETAGVPVLGWRTDDFPAFFWRSSGLPVSARVDDATSAAVVLEAHWSAGLESGVVISVPCPEAETVPHQQVEAALAEAIASAEQAGIRGKDLTPFLLARLAERTGGTTLRANLALLRNNARVAAEIAWALAG